MTKTYSISIAVDGLYATRGKFQYSEGEGIRSGFIEDCDAPWDDAIYTAIEDALTEGEPADGQIEIEGKTYSWVLTAEEATPTTALEISRKAEDIAGCIWEDHDRVGTLAEQLIAASNWVNKGSDGDLTDADRASLLELASLAEVAE